MSWGYDYREYVPVGQRKAQAQRHAEEVAKRAGRKPHPVAISGTKIAKTFWGKAWCDHMESFSDYSNRLPRGRTYVRNGSVADLDISAGKLTAIVAGSDTYEIEIEIDQLSARDWKRIRGACATSIDSVLDLLGGRFSDGVMTVLTDRKDGLFPKPKEIRMSCSCPDWSRLCKHLAAVLYGVGARLDHHPELLFLLRGVDHNELVSEAVSEGSLTAALGTSPNDLAGEDLGAMFGIELDSGFVEQAAPAPTRSRKKPASLRKKTTKKAGAKKKAAKKTTVKKGVKKKVSKKAAGRKRAAKKPAVKKASAGVAETKKATRKVSTTKKKATKKRRS
jgi:uncharacterized Zn finger protein